MTQIVQFLNIQPRLRWLLCLSHSERLLKLPPPPPQNKQTGRGVGGYP
jgi:hypothetical protein